LCCFFARKPARGPSNRRPEKNDQQSNHTHTETTSKAGGFGEKWWRRKRIGTQHKFGIRFRGGSESAMNERTMDAAACRFCAPTTMTRRDQNQSKEIGGRGNGPNCVYPPSPPSSNNRRFTRHRNRTAQPFYSLFMLYAYLLRLLMHFYFCRMTIAIRGMGGEGGKFILEYET